MLFKILHGDVSRISTNITPFHEGYCYVTHNGDIYVDMNIGTADVPNNQRIKLNAKDAETLCGVSLEEIKKSISWDDLLNKPVDISNSDTLTWDGDITGKEVAYDMYYKISDATPAISTLNNGYSMTLSLGDIYSTDRNNCVAQDVGNGMVTLSGNTGIPFAVIIYETQAGIPSGTYFLNTNAVVDEGYNLAVLTINGYDGFTKETIREDYIPDTIARTSDIPEQIQPDWSETYDDSAAYIHNKPFGDFYTIKRTGEETVTVVGKYTTFTLVSNDILEYEELSGVALYSGASGSFPSINRFSDYVYGNYTGILVVTQAGATYSQISNNPFPEVGVYLGAEVEYAVLQVKKIPEKYIPSKYTTTESVQAQIDEATVNFASKDYVDSKQVQSDWTVNDETNPAYIKNRTHWVSDAYQKTLFDSQDVEFLYNADYGVSAANITFVDSLKEGAELTVMFGDTEYPVVVQSLGMNLVFGNLSIAGVGSDTGEPFVSINSTDVDWEIYAQDTANTTHRMSVFYVTQDYHKLDKAYLPDDAILPEVSSEEEGYTITVQDGKWTANRPVGMSVGLGTGGEIFNSYVGDFINEAGVYGHAEGETTKALGQASHTAGKGTIASGLGQYVFGTYNIEDTSESTVDWAPERGKRKYVHIVGNGINDSRRSNAHTLDWNGNAWFAGDVKVGGTGQDDAAAKTLATTEYVHAITSTFETKIDASAKLTEAKTYTDTAISQKSQVQIITWEADD